MYKWYWTTGCGTARLATFKSRRFEYLRHRSPIMGGKNTKNFGNCTDFENNCYFCSEINIKTNDNDNSEIR